jgi:hypothetical protein
MRRLHRSLKVGTAAFLALVPFACGGGGGGSSSLSGAGGGSSTSAGAGGSSGASGGSGGSGASSGSMTYGPGANATIPYNGGGTSGQNGLITSGISPDSCQVSSAFNGGTVTPVSPDYVACYYSAAVSATSPLGFVQHDEEIIGGKDLIHVRLTLNPDFVDNTYGSTAIGWSSSAAGAGAAGMMGPMGMGHTFYDLVDSDHCEIDFKNAGGDVVLSFNLDYLSADANAPSGFACLGVSGGDGNMLIGSASDIVYYDTSLARDLNACGYGSYTVNSPATNANYTPNPATPNWDYDVVYDVWVLKSALPSTWSVSIPYVHASPSKMASTYTVMSAPCPPLQCEGEGCTSGGGCAGGDCETAPDAGCVGEGCSGGGQCVGLLCDAGTSTECVGEGCAEGGACVGEGCALWCTTNGGECTESTACCSGFCSEQYGLCVSATQ